MPVGDSAAHLSQGKTSRMTTRICLRAKNASSTSEIDMKSAKLICCVWSFVVLSLSFLCFSGRSWQDKLADMHKAMTEKEVDAMVVTGLDETACTFGLP